MAMKKDMMGSCMGGMCGRCHSGKGLILGLALLANVYWPFADPWAVVGGLFVLGSLLKMAWPMCGHCK